MNFIAQWLPSMVQTSFGRKALLGIAGLTFACAGSVGHATPAQTPAHTPAAQPAAVVQAVQPDTKPAADGKPSMEKLIPHGVQGSQSRIDINGEQRGNAKAIVEATKKAGMDERAAVISVATSMQESKLENLGHLGDANDHDSLGLFQQRPSSGWGTPEQITNPEYSTKAFLNGLKQVDGWHDKPLTEAAQTVQVSAYPNAYAQWEQQAADIVGDVWTK